MGRDMYPAETFQLDPAPAEALSYPATTAGIGDRLRQRRKSLGLTLRHVAENAGLSVGFISQIERGIAMPSLSSLVSVARVLDVRVSEFLEPPNGALPMTRHAERKRFAVGSSPVGYERLSASFPGAKLRSVLIHQPPNHRSELVAHEGEELFYILAGTLTVEIEGARTVLDVGDTLHFMSTRPHMTWNNSDRPVTILHVCTMDVFGDTPGTSGGKTRTAYPSEHRKPTKGDVR